MPDPSHIKTLNTRLGDSLGLVCGGSLPRFAWKYAPDMVWIVYGRDDRTVVKKTWADAPSASGGKVGKAWLLAEWRLNKSFDNHGFGDTCGKCNGMGSSTEYGITIRCRECDGKGTVAGVRVAVRSTSGYSPYFETALLPGQLPSNELNQNYVWAIRRQLDRSAMSRTDALDERMAEEKYIMERQNVVNRNEHLEASLAVYDENVGAFGNCEPGKRDGYMSFQNPESGSGFVPWGAESPTVAQ